MANKTALPWFQPDKADAPKATASLIGQALKKGDDGLTRANDAVWCSILPLLRRNYPPRRVKLGRYGSGSRLRCGQSALSLDAARRPRATHSPSSPGPTTPRLMGVPCMSHGGEGSLAFQRLQGGVERQNEPSTAMIGPSAPKQESSGHTRKGHSQAPSPANHRRATARLGDRKAAEAYHCRAKTKEPGHAASEVPRASSTAGRGTLRALSSLRRGLRQ